MHPNPYLQALYMIRVAEQAGDGVAQDRPTRPEKRISSQTKASILKSLL